MKMRSVTEQAALDEFLSTAELAGTDFTAEKLNNLKIIHPDQRNPYLLSAGEERSAVLKQDANRKRLTVPRRPAWNETMTKEELEAKERESFLDWRRDLAALQESDDLLMTPFERNIEVWRQLWRVIERSDLVVQIVDARNPLLFRSEDLEKYVKEVDPQKTNLLLVNKADMMTLEQRKIWASYFKEKAINFQFFSAALAKARNEAGQLGAEYLDEDALLGPEDDPTRILSVDELEELFLAHAPAPQGKQGILLLSVCQLSRTRYRLRHSQTDSGRACRISERREILHNQCSNWSKESVRLRNTWKNQAFPNHTSQSVCHSVRLPWFGVSQLCHYEGGASV